MRHGQKPRSYPFEAAETPPVNPEPAKNDVPNLRPVPAAEYVPFDYEDTSDEPEEVLIRVSTEALAGDEDLDGNEDLVDEEEWAYDAAELQEADVATAAAQPSEPAAAEPEPLAEPEPEPEPELLAVAEPLAEPEPEPEPELLAVAEPLAEPEPELLAVAEPLAEPEPELLAVAEPLAEPEPEPELLAEAQPEPELLAVAEPLAEPEPELLAVAEPLAELEPEPEPEPEPELLAVAEPLAEPEPEPEPELLAEAQPEPEAQPELLPVVAAFDESAVADFSRSAVVDGAEEDPDGLAGVEDEEAADGSMADEVEGPSRLTPYEPAQTRPADDGLIQLRLARVHLRTGAFTIARGELEALASRDQLNSSGVLDLAEVRWRTGDLHGAGEAAAAYLTSGGDEALGYVIAAEAAAMANHPSEARRHVEAALRRHLGELEPIFAGIGPHATWSSGRWADAGVGSADAPAAPASAPVEPAPVEPAPVEPAPAPVAQEASISGREANVAAAEASVTASETTPEVVEPESMPITVEADAEVESGRAYLIADDAMMAALHFAVALRLAPGSAGAVLDAIGDRQELALQLVRGDALRMLGLEGDAGKAYLSVATALGAPRPETRSQSPNTITGSLPAPETEPETSPGTQPSAPISAEIAPAPAPEREADDLPPIRWG